MVTIPKPQPPSQRNRNSKGQFAIEEFWERVAKSTVNDCWLWTGNISPNGYGRFGKIYAHRYAYISEYDGIPEGLDLDHLCRVRHCVNPRHLEPVTRKENVRRGNGKGKETHCPQGHPYDSANTYFSKARFGRSCRTCNKERSRRSYAKRATA